MSIYVDELIQCPKSAKWPYTQSCHLTTDSDVEELHKFAEGLGLKRVHFQGAHVNPTFHHYDLVPPLRTLAIQRGAIAISWRDAARMREERGNAQINTRETQETALLSCDDKLDVAIINTSKSNPSTKTVYPLGYSIHSKRIHELMASNPKMLMVDTRFVAYSQIPGWSGDDLKDKYGDRYRYAGKTLGNRNYRSKGGPIRIADPERGIAGLRRYLEEGYSLVLVCGCKNYDTCHLHVICELLSQDMPEVKIVQPDEYIPQKNTIPCLSIQQPWTWLLANGFKDIENREWSTNYRGPILLHAGKTVDDEWFDRSGEINQGLIARYGLEDWGMPEHKKDFATGAIVGRANLVNVVTESDSKWFCGTYGFVLANAQPIEPIPYRGQLKLFDVPRSVLETKPQVMSAQPPTLFDAAIEMPAEQEAAPEVEKSQPVVVEEPQPLCWKCKFPPRWVVDPVDGLNVCACVVEGRREIERLQPKWDAARKRARK